MPGQYSQPTPTSMDQTWTKPRPKTMQPDIQNKHATSRNTGTALATVTKMENYQEHALSSNNAFLTHINKAEIRGCTNECTRKSK